MKVKVFEQEFDPYCVYGVCKWNPDIGCLCDGYRPITDFEEGSVKQMEVGKVFWTKAEFGVDVELNKEIIEEKNGDMSLFGNVDEDHSFNRILDENLQRLFTAEEFIDIVQDYQNSFYNCLTHKYEYDEYTNQDGIEAQCCSNNRGIDEGNDECWFDGTVVWHTVNMKHTVCEDCVKTEFMWGNE